MVDASHQDIDTVVLREQVRLIRDNSFPALVGTESVTGIVALAAYLESGNPTIWFAFGLFTLVQLARTAFIVVGDRMGLAIQRPDLFLLIGSIGSLMTGVCWAAVPFLANSLGGPQAAVTAAISASGVAAGAVLLSASRASYALPYAIPALCGCFMLFLTEWTSNSLLLCISTIFFGVLLTICAYRSEGLLVRSLRLAYERSRLAASLEVANERAQAAVQRFEYLANHDSLTGLLNRSAMLQEVQSRLVDAAVGDRRVGIMLLDLDRFKHVNDVYGHPVGDRLLIEVSDRIVSVVGSDDRVARLGGDEFAIVFDRDGRDLGAIAENLIAVMTTPFDLAGRLASIGVSIGVALYPEHGTAVDDLMSRADIALYAAKEAGRHRWTVFDEKLGARARFDQEIEADLRTALRLGQIRYHYQPQIAIADGRVTGLEALLRWDHPTRGRIAPDIVVAAAQRSNQVEALIGCMLADACRMIGRLDEAGFPAVRVAVNISPRDFVLCDVAALVEAALVRYGAAAPRLEIEITEDAILEGERVGPQLERLERLGVPLAVDDFGVGYSSIARLKDLKIDRLKIDRRFVSGIEEPGSGRTLFEAITAVARSLKMELVAEGIETRVQLDAVTAFGCDVAQGYLFTPPLPPDAVLDWLTPRKREKIAVS